MVTISVVMPTYNTPIHFLKEAVESVLKQTYEDFEFIIINDGSTDKSKEYLDSLVDSRVRIIHNESNLGITKSLNIGLHAAQGKYIARMDADDISMPDRFEKQLVFMRNHPDAIVCGTETTFFFKQSTEIKGKLEDMNSYRVRMLFRNPGPAHPTAFFDREKLLEHQITYDEHLTFAQDYGMWVTVSQYGRVYIMPEVLLVRRLHPDQVSHKNREHQIRCDKMTQKKLLTQLLGDVTKEEVDMHYYCSGFYHDAEITPQINAWYDRLIEANRHKRLYDQRKLKQEIKRIKKRLIYQTFSYDMSKADKAFLFFRYLSFFPAVIATIDTIILKIKKEWKRSITN